MSLLDTSLELDASEALEVLLAVAARIARKTHTFAFRDLEDLLTAPDGFGLVNATPLQRAICRIIDGVPLAELAEHPHVKQAFGQPIDWRPDEAWIIAGIRTAKSLLCAAAAYKMTQTVDVSQLGHGEDARVGVVSIDKDKADAVYNHFVGNIKASPRMRDTLLDEVASERYALVRHPSGKRIEFLVLAGSKAGGSLVSRWMAGVIFDEAARMAGRSEGVVNLDDMLTAVRGRLLDGAQILCPTSPWAPYGPAYTAHDQYFQKPHNRTVVIQADARWLNPFWWKDERAQKLKEKDPDAFQADVEGRFLDQVESLFTESIIEPCVRDCGDLDPEPGLSYYAAMDPATRNNAWTLVVSTLGRDSKKRIVFVYEWRGSRTAPLSPKAVFKVMAKMLAPYGVKRVATDGWALDSLQDNAKDAGLTLLDASWTTKEQTDLYLRVKDAMIEQTIEIHNDSQLREDMKRVKRRTSRNGIFIELPETEDGRHCDFAPAVVRALAPYIKEPQEVPPHHGTQERIEWEAKKRKERLIKEAKLKSKVRRRR
jgi:hypothetical protein